MKKVLVQTLISDGNNYGQVSNPDDLMKAQGFVHDRVSQLTNDFIDSQRNAEIAGFGFSLGTNTFEITLARPGRIYTQDGRQFELEADAMVTISPADDTLGRVDMIVAVLEDDVDSELDLLPFVRLRTADEFLANVEPYPRQNISSPTERHDRCVIRLKTGDPATAPAPPATATNEIPLYLIAVPAGATALNKASLLDVRDVILTLRQLNDLAAKEGTDINNLTGRVNELEDLASRPIDLTQVFGGIRTLGEILADLARQVTASRDLPEVRYDRPKYPLTNKDSSKIVAAGNTDAGTPCVDIDVGGRVNFGDAEIVITPQAFVDQSVNSRFATVGSSSAHVRRDNPITIDRVTQIDSDGAIDFARKLSSLAVGRSRPGIAARDGRYIEIYAGVGSAALGDWLTYDVTNDTLTPRAIASGPALPTSDRPAAFPYGDGTHVLLIANDEANPGGRRVFKLNAVTGVNVEITGTRPTGIQFFGDLIADGKIFIVAVQIGAGEVPAQYWEFDTATGVFTQLSTSGHNPLIIPDCVGGCYYGEGSFVMVNFDIVTKLATTYTFDRSTSQWTQLTVITEPFGGTPASPNALSGFRMANVNGRPLLVGGSFFAAPSGQQQLSSVIWELVSTGRVISRETWISTQGSSEPIISPGFCSLIDGGRASGMAAMIGGRSYFGQVVQHIYTSVKGGLVAANLLDGTEGVGIGPSASFVIFELDPYDAAFHVLSYLASVSGDHLDGSSRVEVSLDDGAHWHDLADNRTLAITDSANPAVRRLRVTLYNNSITPSVMTGITEILDGDGGVLEDRVVVRYDSPDAVRALYIDRSGKVTLEAVIVPSTPDKALIHKVTPDGSSAPTIKNYINRRRPHVKYSAVASAAVAFDNEMAVPVRYVDARAFTGGGDHALYALAEPTVDFDATVNVAGTVDTIDTWIVELEG
jgi:hypothetical protein